MRRRLRLAGSLGGLFGLVFAVAGGMILSSATAVAANNKGDIWLNNVGSMADPGHVPHLQFADIAMLAKYPGGSGGTFEIVAWQPTGDNKSVVYSGNWTYDQSGPDIQQIATISINTLYANTVALGFTAHPKQGFHYKMYCSLGKHDKMKEFWVEGAPVVTASPTPTPTSTTNPSGGVSGETGSKIGLAETGGPILGFGLLLMVLGAFTWLGSTIVRRRS